MQACGLGPDTSIMNETEFYVSHECLLMEYEQALTREDSTTGLWCANSRQPFKTIDIQFLYYLSFYTL